jgi:hypothetical protein
MKKKRRIERRSNRPLSGPAACLRTHSLTVHCDVCDLRVDVMHMPTQQRGWYCPDCPCCRPEEAVSD